MTAPGTAALSALVATLSDALAVWAKRDDTVAQPDVRRAANDACDAIDAMLADLHKMRSALLSETRASDDATAARSDALLARIRSERGQ